MSGFFMEEQFSAARPGAVRFRRALVLVWAVLCLGGCGEPTEAPLESQTITPTPVEEALRPVAPEGGEGLAGTVRDAPNEPPDRPNGPGANLAARIFGDHPFRLVEDYSLSRRRRLYVYGAEAGTDDGPCLFVLVGRVDDRVSAERLPCFSSYVRPQVRLLNPEYGPALIRVEMTSEHEGATDSTRGRRRGRRAPARTFRERREILLSLDQEAGLRKVHETVTSSNSIASARTTWDARAGTLTTGIQRRNPPGRERCRRPRPETVVHTWRDGHFEQTQRDTPSAPCGE